MRGPRVVAEVQGQPLETAGGLVVEFFEDAFQLVTRALLEDAQANVRIAGLEHPPVHRDHLDPLAHEGVALGPLPAGAEHFDGDLRASRSAQQLHRLEQRHVRRRAALLGPVLGRLRRADRRDPIAYPDARSGRRGALDGGDYRDQAVAARGDLDSQPVELAPGVDPRLLEGIRFEEGGVRTELPDQAADRPVEKPAAFDRLEVVLAHEVENAREQGQVRVAGGRKAARDAAHEERHQASGEEGEKKANPVTSHEPGSASNDWTRAVGLGVMAEIPGAFRRHARSRRWVRHPIPVRAVRPPLASRGSPPRWILSRASVGAPAYFIGLNIGRFASVAT